MKRSDITDETVVLAAITRAICRNVLPITCECPDVPTILKAIRPDAAPKVIDAAIERSAKKGYVDTTIRTYLATPTDAGIAMLNPEPGSKAAAMIRFLEETP